MNLTLSPPRPTTCARKLKPLIGSRPTEIFSSGHLRWEELATCWMTDRATYSAKFVALEVLRLSTAETTFVYKVRKVLLHHLFDHLDSLVQAFFGGASDAEVQRRVLFPLALSMRLCVFTYSSSCHVLVRVVFSASSDILHV